MFLRAAQQTVQQTCQDVGVFVMRLALGAFFVFHGAQKLFGLFDGLGLGGYANLIEALQLPFPQYVSVAVSGIEFVGGLLLILGFYSRIAAILLAATMLATGYFVYQNAIGVHVDQVTYPMNLAYLFAGVGCTLIGLCLTGPGRLSLGTLLVIKQSILPSRRPETILG